MIRTRERERDGMKEDNLHLVEEEKEERVARKTTQKVFEQFT